MSLQTSRTMRPIADGARGHSMGWWGAIVGLLALFHLVVGAHVGVVYLRAASPSWPPDGMQPPGMAESLIAVALVALAAALATTGDLLTRRSNGGAALMLPIAAVLAAVAGWLRGSVTIFSDHPVSEHAYWSMRWFLGALDVVLIWTLMLVLAVVAVHVWRGRIRPGHHEELAVTSIWAWGTTAFVLGSWLVFSGVTVWWGDV